MLGGRFHGSVARIISAAASATIALP